MADIRIDGSRDLVVQNNDLVIVSDPESVGQHVAIRLRFFRGEFELDTRLGVPYLTQILGKSRNLNTIRSVLRGVVEDTPGVATVDRFTVAFDGVSRLLSVEFAATTTSGESLTFDEEFVVA